MLLHSVHPQIFMPQQWWSLLLCLGYIIIPYFEKYKPWSLAILWQRCKLACLKQHHYVEDMLGFAMQGQVPFA